MLLVPLLAGSPSVLPEVESRLGLDARVATWTTLAATGEVPDVDVGRVVSTRIALSGAFGLTDRLELGVVVPGGFAQASTPDCGAGLDCASVATLGAVGVEARYQLTHLPVVLTPALGLSSQAWNAGLRERYLLADAPTTDVVPALYVGRRWEGEGRSLEVSGRLAYAWRLAAYEEPVANLAPANEARAAVFVTGGLGPVSLQVHAATRQRLGGYDLGDADAHATGDARWVELDADDAAVGGQVRVDMGALSLHVEGARVVWAENAASDTLTVGLGASLAL